MALYLCMYGSSESLTFWDTLPSKDVRLVGAKVKTNIGFSMFFEVPSSYQSLDIAGGAAKC